MSDNKKYYYIKVKDSYFEKDSVKILESQNNGYIYSLIILKLCLKAASHDGCLMMTKKIPYTPDKVDILAKIINHDVAHVREAIKMASELDIISIVGSREIWMTEIQDMIGTSSTEGDRKRKYRKKLKEIKNGTFVHQTDGTFVHQETDNSPITGHLSTRDKILDTRDQSLEFRELDKRYYKEKNNKKEITYLNISNSNQDALSVFIQEAVNYWNTKSNLFPCKYLIPSLPKLSDIRVKFDTYDLSEIKSAIDNLSKAYDSLDQKYRPKNFQNFIVNSLDNWFEERKENTPRKYRTREERLYFDQVCNMPGIEKEWKEGKRQECIDSLNAIGEDFIDYECT